MRVLNIFSGVSVLLLTLGLGGHLLHYIFLR